MPWLEIIVGAGLVGIVLVSIWIGLRATSAAAKSEAKAETSQETLDAMQKSQRAAAEFRALSRAERLKRLYARARRRAGTVPGDERGDGPRAD